MFRTWTDDVQEELRQALECGDESLKWLPGDFADGDIQVVTKGGDRNLAAGGREDENTMFLCLARETP